MKYISVLTTLVLLSALMTSVSSQEVTSPESHGKESYTKVKRIKSPDPVYPRRALNYLHAGVVDFVYMVDVNGKAFEASVVRSSSDVFEENALDAVLGSTHEPAILNGGPVEAATTLRVLFSIKDQEDVVGSRFYMAHKRALKELNKSQPDKEKMLGAIESMQKSHILTPYALWKLNILKFYFAQKFQTIPEQVEALQRVLLFERMSGDDGKIEETELRASLWRAIFVLETKRMRLLDALDAYQSYSELVDEVPNEIVKFKKSIDQVLAKDQPIGTLFDLNSSGDDFLRPISKEFSFEVAEGKLHKLKLRCQANFSEMEINLNAEYKLPESWGTCDLHLLGEPGSNGRVIFY